jgi:hypothetical protein
MAILLLFAILIKFAAAGVNPAGQNFLPVLKPQQPKYVVCVFKKLTA